MDKFFIHNISIQFYPNITLNEKLTISYLLQHYYNQLSMKIGWIVLNLN